MFYGELGVWGGQVCSAGSSLVQPGSGWADRFGVVGRSSGRRNFFSGGRIGRKSSVLLEIVRSGWQVLVDFGVVLSGFGELSGQFWRSAEGSRRAGVRAGNAWGRVRLGCWARFVIGVFTEQEYGVGVWGVKWASCRSAGRRQGRTSHPPLSLRDISPLEGGREGTDGASEFGACPHPPPTRGQALALSRRERGSEGCRGRICAAWPRLRGADFILRGGGDFLLRGVEFVLCGADLVC